MSLEAKSLLAGALALTLAPALFGGALDIPSKFSEQSSYKEVQKSEFVSGSLPEGWRDESFNSKSNCVYSFQTEGSDGFLRVACPPSDKAWIQFSHPMKALDSKKAFKMSLKARGQLKNEVRFMIQAMGTTRSFAVASLRLGEAWKEYSVTFACGPTDVKNVGFLVLTRGSGTLDIASLKLEEIPLAEHLPQTCISVPPEFKGWQERLQRDVKQLAEQKPDFVIMGDSVTVGWEKQGKEAWEKQIAPFNSYAFGVAGDRVEQLLWRLENSPIGKECKPKYVAILIGSNNFFSASAEDVGAGMRNLIKEIQARSLGVKVLIVGLFPAGQKPDDLRRGLAKEINACYEKIADGKSVFYMYFGDAFLEPDGSISKETFFDFIHCTPKSYEFYAGKLSGKLKELMGK